MPKPIIPGLLASLLAAPAFAAPAEEGSGGMPQFDFENVAASQVFWLMISFGLLYLLMRAMLPKVAGVAETRANTIGGDLDAADKARLDADTKQEAYEASLASSRARAQGLIADAKAEAAKANEARMAEADKAAQARLAAAEEELNAAREKALGKLDAIAADATKDIVEKLTGTRPADDKAAAAVASARV
ncbi:MULTISPECIES: F0F1 ATP synthase subunit B family protein [Pacificimonas]|nr:MULTISPECIES: hypothetical protein [Pacificimonas]MBZ6378475.1 ATPase [Pacificimonas aurantium]